MRKGLTKSKSFIKARKKFALQRAVAEYKTFKKPS